MKILLLALICALAKAGPVQRENRASSGCLDAFANIPSPCHKNPTKQVYFPHPTDTTKFLQCDVFERMYIIQCPVGELYNAATTSCRPRNQGTQAPPVVSTQRPVQTNRPGLSGNPCTPQNIAQNNIYFAIKGDDSHFIECDPLGSASILPCPAGLRWDQKVVACVYPPNMTPTNNPVILPPTTKNPFGNSNANPCTAAALASGKFFFPYPDAHKFIQCDPWGDVYINSCPSGLIWNSHLETCFSPFQAVGGNV
ncbi:uncharacterized protein [Haliotis cracherodii]|uniref:uncharacterized protein n=1 Tax=Haliotis cracherodii TaxID=6455 RepID=UPI0039EB669C